MMDTERLMRNLQRGSNENAGQDNSGTSRPGHQGSAGGPVQPPRPVPGSWATRQGPVYHHEIFDHLAYIAAGVGSYVQTPEGDQSLGDVTAYKPNQQYWGPSPEDRPDVLCLWEAPATSQIGAGQPGPMVFNGRKVLDWKGNEIRDFSNLPLTISSKVEGWRVEAWMREDPRLKLNDIMARLWTARRSNGDIEPATTVRIISSRTTRFRDRAGLISWNPRPDAALKINFLDRLRTPQQRASNQSICRDLTSIEMNQMRQVGLGTRNQQRFGRSHSAYVNRIHRRAQVVPNQATGPTFGLGMQGFMDPQPTESQRGNDQGILYESDAEYDDDVEEEE